MRRAWVRSGGSLTASAACRGSSPWTLATRASARVQWSRPHGADREGTQSTKFAMRIPRHTMQAPELPTAHA